ncbi:MAG TPA: SMP-30/gluconolactonase/LRE family protein [Candidatus Binataceae bacterium]|nr:SMP-30/gluconolactonase/LRE family protein [Candidatus Binataceae bacterium]
MAQMKPLLEGLVFPEGPRWHDGKLWFSDMHAHKVRTVGLDGRAEDVVDVPSWPSGLGWLPDGTLLIVSMTDRKLLRYAGGKLATHADIAHLASFHCNDMVVDGRGRAYVGNFGFDLLSGGAQKQAELVLVNPDGSSRVVASGLDFPNGAVVTQDGRTLIVGESLGHRLTAFHVEDDGSLTNQSTWAELGDAVPDGIALDAGNAIWVASPLTKELLYVQQGGKVAERIKCDSMPIACALGGPDRKTLFVLLADSINPDECRTKKSARIDVMDVAVAGAGWP